MTDAVNIIYAFLNETIIVNYRKGAKSLIKTVNSDYKKGKFTLHDVINRVQFDKDSELFKIRYNKQDALAVQSYKLEAFAVANVGDYELNEKLKDLYLQYRNNREEFHRQAQQLMLDYGIGLQDQMPVGWLESQMVTAELRSYGNARWIKVNDPDISDLYPAIKTFTRKDSRVRESHRLMYEGKIYLKSDPNLPAILPPALGQYRCRCTWQPAAKWELSGEEIPLIKKADYKDNLDMENVSNANDIHSIYQGYLKGKFKELPDDVLKDIKKKLNAFSKQLNQNDIIDELNG